MTIGGRRGMICIRGVIFMRVNQNINNMLLGGDNSWWASGANRFQSTRGMDFSGLGGMGFGDNMTTSGPDFRANLTNMRNNADRLQSALRSILGRHGANTPFGADRPVSGDDEIFTIRSADANRLRHVNTDDFSVDVMQLAQAQQNAGTRHTANQRTSLDAGSHHIGIRIGNQQFDINFTVGANDTNRDVQNRIATAINARNIGVTASVNTQDGQSSLVLESRETGIANAGQPNFSVVSRQGNDPGSALNFLGISNITQQAQNAEFSVSRGGVQGAVQTSRSNDVNIGFGVELTLAGVGNAEITMERDTTGQQNALRSMVNAFNDMIQAARDSGSNTRLERDLNRMARTFNTSLERVGIFMNRDGWMDINEERMARAAESGELEQFARGGRDGSGTGFIGSLGRLAENVSRNPQSFAVDPTQNQGRHNPRTNANLLNQFNRLVGMGMLFDTFM